MWTEIKYYGVAGAEGLRGGDEQRPAMVEDRQLRPDDVEESMTVRLAWSARGGSGPTTEADGEVTRVWRPEGDVREFTVAVDDDVDVNVYADYRQPTVERVVDDGDGDPDSKTVGRLDDVTRLD